MLKSRGMYDATVSNMGEVQKQTAITQWKTLPTEEPEVVETLAVITYRIIGHEEVWFPRFYSCLFWLLGGVGLYLLLARMFNPGGAVLGTLFYLFVPYGILASRTFMPDPLMLALLVWSIWAVFRWSEQPTWAKCILAGVLCGLTIYVKATAVFYIAGAIIAMALGQFGFKKAIRQIQLWVMGILAILPGFLYNLLGIYVFKFISSDATYNRIVLKELANPVSYLQWNNMVGTVVGFAVFLLAIAGVFMISQRKTRSLVCGLWIGYFVFGFFFIYYYTSHDYYHLPLIVLVAIGLAAFGEGVLRKANEIIRPGWFAKVLLISLLFIGIGESVWQVRNDFKRTDYRPQVQFWAALGKKLQGSTSLALTEDYNGRLSYWGWYNASYMPDLNELAHRALTGHEAGMAQTFAALAQGKDFFLVTMLDDLDAEPEFKQMLYQTYPIYGQGKGYVIFDLRQGH